MNNIEAFANEHADDVLKPLRVSTAVGPVLATPAYGAYAAGAGAVFTLGLISDVVEHHRADEVALAGPVPGSISVDRLLDMRVSSIS